MSNSTMSSYIYLRNRWIAADNTFFLDMLITLGTGYKRVFGLIILLWGYVDVQKRRPVPTRYCSMYIAWVGAIGSTITFRKETLLLATE